MDRCDLHYEFINSKNLIISSSFGYGFRQDNYRVGNQLGIPPIGEKSQKYLSASLGLRHLWKMDKFHFSTGIEIPIFWMSEYSELYLQDNPDQIYHFRETTTGGRAFGLNSTSSIKWFFSDRFYLASNVSFGVIQFNVGEITTAIVEEQNPVVHGEDMWERENTYKKIILTQPELFLGIGFRL